MIRVQVVSPVVSVDARHTVVIHGVTEQYDGAYTVTPSGEAQTLETAGLVMAENITVAPIPSNYGRITWNGSYLTVS